MRKQSTSGSQIFSGSQAAFSNINIRPAQQHDLRKISYVWHMAYLQKEKQEAKPPTAIELDQMYRSEGKGMFERSWIQKNNNFIVASVPTSKVSFVVPDKGQAMAGMCEYSRESIKYNDREYMDALYLERLYTIKTKQCPVGKALMLECINIAKEMQVSAIVLDAQFKASREWYIDQIGFEPFQSQVFRPESNRPHHPKSQALFLHRDNFDDAEKLLKGNPASVAKPKTPAL